MNFTEHKKITGHLQIAKQYSDNRPEVILFDDHNVIVSGMSVGLSYLFTGSGSTTVTDFQLDRFQVGVSGNSDLEVSSTYELSGPVSTTGDYGSNTQLIISPNSQLKNGSIVTPPTLKSPFALIPFGHVTRIDNASVRYTLVLDEEACNIVEALNEIGLFMKDPTGMVGDDASILIAYRYFSDIVKTSDFSLVFRWTINF
tara:strand:+ start:502 stop:1101 length:600 start_codon:yes stop_codon:yes gene_type:complete